MISLIFDKISDGKLSQAEVTAGHRVFFSDMYPPVFQHPPDMEVLTRKPSTNWEIVHVHGDYRTTPGIMATITHPNHQDHIHGPQEWL